MVARRSDGMTGSQYGDNRAGGAEGRGSRNTEGNSITRAC